MARMNVKMILIEHVHMLPSQGIQSIQLQNLIDNIMGKPKAYPIFLHRIAVVTQPPLSM